MDYSNFDYKKACSELTVRELEALLFKCRMLGVIKIITGSWKKYKPSGIVFITLFILYGSVVFLYSLLYATFEFLFYSIFRKNSQKDILRYSDIKWSQNHVNNILNDNEYTTFADIERVYELAGTVKEDKENVPTINRARICDKKTERIETFYFLRGTLKISDTLCGVVLKTKYRNVQNDISKPDYIQVISFGEDIDYALRALLRGKIKFYTNKKEKKSYVCIENGNLQPFIQSVEEAVQLKGIKVSLIQDN